MGLTDDDIEARLRRYRPSGPPARLRDRCLVPARQPRVWPWAAAAAALWALALGMNSAMSGMVRHAAIDEAPDPSVAAVAQLADALGGDEAARRIAEQAVYEDMMQGLADRILGRDRSAP